MRIAVLFYGQPRFLDITKRLIKEEFEFSGHTTDYFAHFWDKIGFTPSCTEEKIKEDISTILSDYFSAKKFKIENNNKINDISNSFKTIFELLKKETNENLPVSTVSEEVKYKFSQHYSLEQAFDLMKEHEIKHKFKYDIVIKARTDIVYSIPELFSDETEYIDFKNQSYFDIPVDTPAMRCNALRIVKLNDYNKGEKPTWSEQPVFEYKDKKLKLEKNNSYFGEGFPWEYNWNYRLAYNDWCLITNRKAAEIMFNGWYTGYIHALGFDLQHTNMLSDKTYIRHKPKFISNSEHCIQGFLAYMYNIEVSRIKPQRRDYRLLNRESIKKNVITDGKIYALNEQEIISGIRKIFKERYNNFYKKVCQKRSI